MSAREPTYPFGLGGAKSPEEILDRMARIVEADQVCHCEYVDSHDVDRERYESGAICGGHKFCAIGTLLFAAGQPIEYDATERGLYIMGAWDQHRDEVMGSLPYASVVRDALNRAAQARIDKDDDYWEGEYQVVPSTTDPLEIFFENYESVGDGGKPIGYEDLLDVIGEARELLRTSAA